MTIVAVTGASGFVGGHLCDDLAGRGHTVIPVSRPQLESTRLAENLTGVHSVVHLAARAHVLEDSCADPRAEFMKSNVGLTQKVAQAAHAAGVRRFIFISSAGVLGVSSPPGGFEENSPPHPHDFYTQSKLAAEEWLNERMAARLELIILRPPLIHGPGAPGNLMRLLRLALRGWPLPIGALRSPRSILAVRNLTDLISHLAGTAAAARGTLLVADRETTSVAQLFRAVAECAGHRPWLAPLPLSIFRVLLAAAGRGADLQRLTGAFVLRPRTALEQFGWLPPHAMLAEIRRMVQIELDRPRRPTPRG